MSAPLYFPPDSAPEVDARTDRTHGYVIVLDPQAAAMEARLRAGARWAEALFNMLIMTAAILSGACLSSQAMKWIGM